MPDFSYLDSSGVGQIETPTQTPQTLQVQSPQVNYGPQGNVDFSNIWKVGGQDPKPTPLFNDTLDMSQFKGKTPPRSFDADRLIPYKQSGAYKDLGYNPDMPEDKIQAQYDYDQSNWEAAKSSVASFFHITGQAFKNYFKTYGDSVKSMVNLNQQGTMYEDMIPQVQADNEAQRSNLRFKGDLPMHWYNYLPIPGLMKGDVAEELLPQLGFTVGTGGAAILENLGVSLLSGGAGEVAEIPNTASKMYKLISEFNTLARGAEVAKTLYSGPVVGLRAGLDMWRLTNATLSETSLEGATNYVQHKQKLIQDYIDKNGHAPQGDDMHKIEQSSHDVANETMWGEFPVLFASNWIQYRNLLAPSLAKRLAEGEALKGMKIVNTAEDKIASQFAVTAPFAGATRGAKILGATSHFLKNAVTEGLEETGQRLVSTAASDYEQKLYNKKDHSAMNSLFDVGVPDILSDSGLQEFMGGFVTGGLFHSFGMAGNKLATLKGVFNPDGTLTGNGNLLTKLGFGTEEIARAKVKGQLQSVANLLNTEDLKTIFKEEGLSNFIKATQTSQAMNEALHQNDLFNIGNLKSNALVRFLYTGLETGKLDLRLGQLNAFRDLSQEDLNKFLDIDTGVMNKGTTAPVIDNIIGKAQDVKEIFDQEKDRFKDKELSAIKAFNAQDKSHEGLEQSLRTKYNVDANEKDIRGALIQKLAEDAENEDLKTDLATVYDSMVNKNMAYMNVVATREGRKAAVFAATNMQIDGDRSKEAIRTMQDYDLAYTGLNNALNLKELQKQHKDLLSQAKAVQGVDNERMLEIADKVDRLDKLLHHLQLYYRENIDGTPYDNGMPITESQHQDEGAKIIVAAREMYNFLHDEITPEHRTTRAKEERMLGLILRLEKRNRDNISLYNRLATSDQGFEEYSQHETEKTARTIGKWANDYINAHAEQPETTPQTGEQQAAEHTEERKEEDATGPVQPPPTPMQQQFDAIRDKTTRGEPLSSEDRMFLNNAALVDPNVAQFNAQYLAQQPKPQQTQPPVPTTQTVYVSPKVEQTGYIPEKDKTTKEDEQVEKSRVQEHNGQVIDNPDRTIVNEIPKEEFNKVQPQLEGGYTAWKQGFFDYVAQNDLVERFQGQLAVDQASNYPADSAQHKYLTENPGKAGLVLIITDKAGNSTFTEDYVPSRKGGKKIVHSMPGSPGKQALLAKMRSMGITRIDGIQFSNLSQGIFDELENPRQAAMLLDGISQADYQFIIAQGPAGSDIYYENGMALRNGGLYIKTQGSYIKLLPEYAGNLVIGTDSHPDVYNLIGRNYNTYEDAKEIAEFLQKLFYTNKEKGGLQFSIDKNGNQYQLNASIVQTGKALPLNLVELTGNLKGQRINIDMNSLGTNIKFFHVEEGKVQSLILGYNELIRNNTLTNKKAYETAEGKKVLKPVNRYLTLAASLQHLADTLEPQVATTIPQEAQNIVSQVTENQKRVTGKTDDSQFYIIDGEQYRRVSNVIPNDFDGDSALYENSRVAGHTVDGIVRAFFSTGDITKPEGIGKKAFNNIIDELSEIKKTIEARGEQFITNNVVLFDPNLKIAGEVDILSVDKTGKFRIYDVKTSKDFSKYDLSYKGKMTKRQQHTNQQSAYSNLFTSQYGVSPVALGILPFEIGYDTKGYIQSAKKLKGISLTYDPNISSIIPITGQKVQPSTEEKPQSNETLTQPATKPKRKKIDPNQDTGFGDTDRLLRQKTGLQELTVPMKEEAQWINERFGQEELATLVDIMDAGAWAMWTRSGITLLRNAPQGTGYHEAWHHFSQLYITPTQRAAIYDEVRDKVPSLTRATDLQVEEHMAEDFRGYVLSDGKNILGTSSKRNTLFRRVLEFLKKWFQDITGRRDLERLYRDLYRGDLKSYKPDIANAQFGKLNAKIVDAEGNELLNNQKSFRLMNHLESVAGQALAEGGISVSQFMTGDKDLSRQRALELGRQMRIAIINQYNDIADELDTFEEKYPGKTSPLFDTWEDLGTIIKNFPSVFRQFYVQSAYNSGILSREDQEDLDVDIEDAEKTEANFGGKQWDVSGNEESVLDSATAETKALIKSLSKVEVDQNGTPVKEDGRVKLFRNEFGLNEPVNFIRTINNLGNLLEGSFSYDEMLDKIKDSGNQRRFPELALLEERLVDPKSATRYTDVKQLSSFLKSFSKTYIPVYTLVRLRGGNFLFREETRRSQDVIEREWSNRFSTIPKDSPLVKNGTIQFDGNDRPFINTAATLDYDLSSATGQKDFLSLLGININPRAEGTREYNEAVNPAKLGYVLQSIRRRLKAGQKITNPVYDLRREYKLPGGGVIKSEKSTINDITSLESKFTDTNPSMAFRNAEGKVQYGLSENNWVTNNNYWLSRTQNYSQITNNPNTQHLNIDNNPYIAHSLFLNKLFNLDPNSQSYGQRRRVNGELVKIMVGNYNGYEQEQEEGKNNKGATTASLSPRDKLIMDLNSLLLAGAIEIMRTESSSSAFFVKLSDYADQEGRVKDLPFTAQELDADPRNAKVIDYFLGAFQDELATIANKFNSNLPDYRKNIGRFTMFDGILTKETKDAIMKDISSDKKLSVEKKQDGLDTVYATYRAVVAKEIGDFLEKEVKDFENLLKEQSIGHDDISKTLTQGDGQNLGMPAITTAFVINDFILNSEFAKLFDGNVGFFKAYHKRAKGNTSTGTRAFTDDFLKGYLNQTKGNTLAGSLGDTSDANLNETKTLVYKDDQRSSVYTTGKNSMYRRALRALGQEDATTNKLLDKAYGGMNVADGQGHSTLDFYREMRMRVSNWSYADEVQYQKEVIWFRQEYNLGTEEQKTRDNDFLKKFANISSTFPPMKMQYNGALKQAGVFAPVLDKFSVAPLIPRVIKGTVWEDRNMKLLREGIGYTKFESGTKKYKWTPTEFYEHVKDYTIGVAADPEKYNAATHLSEGLKEQLKTSSEPKDEATWGTQMRKLFLANLFNSGVAPDKFRQVLDNYVDLLNKVEDQQKKSLYKEFGITEEGDKLAIRDVKNFVKTLQRQANTRALNDNIKNFIQYDTNTKSFVYPLEISLNKVQVQDLISGMIFSKLTRLKVNGDMLIQVASSGFEDKGFKYTNATEEDNLKYGSNGLPFYEPTFNADGTLGTTKAMRVKVALIKEWTKLLNATHMDGDKMGTLERLNEALKDEGWREANRKKITMVGYRIPTQGANSMEFMEVHEFLPSVAGSIVILPAEIVAKAGSDYDIDKLPIIRPSLTDDGELADEAPEVYEKKMEAIRKRLEGLFRKEKDVNAVRKGHDYTDANRIADKILFGYDAEEIEQEIDSLILDNDEIQDLLSQYHRVASNRSGALTNKVIDLYKQVLSSPEMFKQLITPNNVEMVKPVAQEIARATHMAGFDAKGDTKEFTNTDVLKYRSNLIKFQQLLSGKRDVGIFAKANTMSQLLQQSGMLIRKNYRLFNADGSSMDRQFTQTLFSPEEREKLAASKVDKDGNVVDMIDYSSNVDVDGIFKQEYLSQMINGTVDVAGDPWYMGLLLNDNVKSAFVHLINQGVPARRALLFLAHPAVQRLTKALANADPMDKWRVIGSALGMGTRGKKIKVLQAIEDIDTGKNYQTGFHFREDELLQHIKNPSSAKEWYNRQVMAHYLKQDEQGKMLRDLQTITSFDTAKYITPISAQNNLDLRDMVRATGLFDWDGVRKIMEHSMISPFNNIDKGIEIFEKLMPVGMHKAIIEESADIMRNFRGGDKGQRIRLERTLNNDWIEFIIKNFGEIDGINWEDYARDLLIFNGGNEVLATKLTELKNRMPQLAYYDAFKRLYNDTSERSVGWRNIRLERGLDNGSDYQNVLIEELTQLSNFQGNEISGATFTPEQVLEVRDFFKKLSYLAFMQSGFNKSRLYFTDVIPSDNLVPGFKEALNNFSAFVGQHPETMAQIIHDFRHKFKEQNPTFVIDNEEFPSREVWRGKLYRIFAEGPEQPLGQSDNTNPAGPTSAEPDGYVPSDTTIGDDELTKDMSKPTNTYTNHSGGADGADMAWDSIGRDFGITDHRHYRPEDTRRIPQEARDRMETDVNNAARGLGRPQTEFNGKDLVRRNWFQVMGADAIYAIGRIMNPMQLDPKGFANKSGKQIVAGGTGWAVEMAIQKGKPVHVFDMSSNKWYAWDVFQNKFVEEDTPTLTRNFAGIGSRELTKEGVQAIRDVYTKTNPGSSSDDVSDGLTKCNI